MHNKKGNHSNEFWKKIRNAQKHKGMTQQELAKIIKTTKSTISRIERNLVKKPRFITLFLIASILRVDISEEIKEVGDTKEQIAEMKRQMQVMNQIS